MAGKKGGKGGGAKKNGGACGTGEVAICLSDPLYESVKKAVNEGTPGAPCTAGSTRVCLGMTDALLLLTAISNGLAATGSKVKTKGKGKNKGGKKGNK